MLEALRCVPLGPVGSVAAALTLIEATPKLDGAVLDCNLGKEMVWRVADVLAARFVAFVFSTGYGAEGVATRFAGRPVLAKPYNLKKLEQALIPQLERSAAGFEQRGCRFLGQTRPRRSVARASSSWSESDINGELSQRDASRIYEFTV